MHIPNLRIVQGLLEDPFGPYHDREVLSPQCQTKSRQTLVLKSFQLEHNEQIIGYIYFFFYHHTYT